MPLKQRQRHIFNILSMLFALLICVICAHSSYASQPEQGQVRPKFISKLGFTQPISSVMVGKRIDIRLDDGQLKSFEINHRTINPDDSISIKGLDKDGAKLLLTSSGDVAYGSITGGDLNYTISSDKEMGLILVNQAHQDFPEIDLAHDAMIPPTKNAKLPGIDQMSNVQKQSLDQASVKAKTNGESVVTMLVIYSAEFGQGFSSPEARINDLLNFTNQSLQDSDVNMRFTLAIAQQLNFDNSLGTGTVLNQVTNGTGAFANVAALRNQVGADMVAVLSFANGNSANGVAWVNGDDPNFAFSATRLSPRCCNSVFAHELGHNLGSGHERASVNSSASSPCSNFNFTGYSCGHGNASRNWGTIMSRLNSDIVGNVFSNPLSTSCLGEPCGVPEGQTGAADNTRSFNIARLLVSQFRDDPVAPPIGVKNTSLAPIFSLLLEDN